MRRPPLAAIVSVSPHLLTFSACAPSASTVAEASGPDIVQSTVTRSPDFCIVTFVTPLASSWL